MRYGQIRKYDVANGPGIRVSFFVMGCTHNCFNCFNREYQDFNFGEEWTGENTRQVIEYLNFSHIKGLSILGGEPFQNEIDLREIIIDIKRETNKDIWIWSGYTFEELIKVESRKKLLEVVDVLVDGPFIEKYKDLTLKFRGSSNQRIIDVKESLKNDRIVLYNI